MFASRGATGDPIAALSVCSHQTERVAFWLLLSVSRLAEIWRGSVHGSY